MGSRADPGGPRPRHDGVAAPATRPVRPAGRRRGAARDGPELVGHRVGADRHDLRRPDAALAVTRGRAQPRGGAQPARARRPRRGAARDRRPGARPGRLSLSPGGPGGRARPARADRRGGRGLRRRAGPDHERHRAAVPGPSADGGSPTRERGSGRAQGRGRRRRDAAAAAGRTAWLPPRRPTVRPPECGVASGRRTSATSRRALPRRRDGSLSRIQACAGSSTQR